MKLTITKSKNFIDDCQRYEKIIRDTKDNELENLYKRFLSQAKTLDSTTESLEMVSNVTRQNEERSRLKSIRLELEKRIILLKDKIQQS